MSGPETAVVLDDGADDIVKKTEEGMTNEKSTSSRKPTSEEDAAWFIPRIFFHWAQPMFTRASELKKEGKALEYEDLLHMSANDYGGVVGTKFDKAWKIASAKEDAKQANTTGKTKGQKTDADGTEKEANEEVTDLNSSHSTTIIASAIRQMLGYRFIFAGFIKAINSGLQFCFPIILNQILIFIEDRQTGAITNEDSAWLRYKGYWLSVMLFFAMFAKAITESNYFHIATRAGYQARVGVSVAVYNKSLRLANAARQGTTLGELVNLMQVDASKIEMFVPQIHVLWDGLLQITGYMTILYTLIGWPCFVGLALMIMAGPVQAILMKRMYGYNRQMSKFTDQRVKTTNEALQGIQSVKMYTWEESFEKQIATDRGAELGFLRSIAVARGFSNSYMSALPGVVAVLSFTVYALVVNDDGIRASTLFAALVAFEQLRFPLLFYPMALAQLSMAQGSAARVQSFLRMREVTEGASSAGGDSTGVYNRKINVENKDDVGISVKDATIYWNDKNVPLEDNSSIHTSVHSALSDTESETTTVRYAKPILNDVTFEVKSGELSAIIGRVASGKSTICSALLNEALLDSGSISVSGRIAYAAQTPWILNATLRDNILFGRPYNEERYQKVLEVCQLTHDLEMLDNGDMTEIGEKGINLSGGQKQRVSVARAAYSDADIIILDDPLSALDPEVGRKMFEDCIVNFLHNKTRFFVTNQLQFLNSCDNVVALSKRRVIEQGSYEELMANEGGELHRLINELNATKEAPADTDKDEGKQNDSTDEKQDPTKSKQKGGKAESAGAAPDGEKNRKKADAALTSKEERSTGAVSFQVYKKYFQAGGGYFKFAFVFFAFVLSAANSLAINSWVSFWTSDPQYERFSEGFYLAFYFLFAITLGLATFLRSYLLATFGVNASYNFHTNLLQSVLSAPQSFFDTTPIGRILSRFSKDLYSIDLEVSSQFDMFLFMALAVTTGIATILFVTPWFGVTILPLGYLYITILNYFRDVSRETKRLESISRSPVYAQFSETLGGLSTIRAYGESDRFILQFEQAVDGNTRAYYCNRASDRWLSIRLELIGATVAGLAAVFASNVVINGAVSGQESSDSFASLAGLSLNYAISITSMLNWLVRMFAQLEAGMNSCERILYYTEQIPQEAPRTTDELAKQLTKGKPPAPQGGGTSSASTLAVLGSNGKVSDLPADWPRGGDIDLKNLRMRYRHDTPLVLKGLNLTIKSGERIGVVGRTGSGKSSLLLTLLRLVEPDLLEDANYEAPISIDGVDILRIGLKDLRSKLGIIPQNPVLFSGTIRSNVDPFEEYTDEQIWEALKLCGMKEAVEEMPGDLGAVVAEYGENLSAGSRQMLVLGRAVLRQCKVLLLDEATSSVDYETDREIQRTLREAFAGATVLTIAHRIDTIMDSDKILVMKDGLAAEFDAPQTLLSDETSLFSDIVRHTKAEDEE